MKKTYKIDVDCANCANKMESAAQNTAGVKSAVVNFMALKMVVEFDEGADPKAVMQEVRRNCKRVEDDCEVYLRASERCGCAPEDAGGFRGPAFRRMIK